MIGKGGSGCVYLAEDLNIGQNWAVKQIYFSNSLNRKLADHEVDMMKQLDYYMFPRIVDAWQDKDSYYIVSDYIEGVSLATLIKNRRIPKSTAFRWSKDLANALYYLHSRDPAILYLDLKPDNIMVKPDGSICLIDFGIAKSIVEDLPPLGTKGYAAPEQYGLESQKMGYKLSPATDVYALGMTMYVLYSSSAINESHDIQFKRIHRDYSIPRSIRKIILKCINSNPKRRYSHAGNLLSALNHIGERFHERKLKFIVAILAVLMIPVGISMYLGYEQNLVLEQNEAKLISEVSKMTEDGEYTKEAIRLICTYLDSNCLGEDIKRRFTYEVAENYFLVQRNYKEALKYYKKIDSEAYPEISYCIELCKLQTSFSEDYRKREECLQNFLEYNDNLEDSLSKYENYLLIATCYEQEAEIDDKSLYKARLCLEKGLKEIDSLIENSKAMENKACDIKVEALEELRREFVRRCKQF